MKEQLNWVVIGTGVIANETAAALRKQGRTLYGVANRTQSKAVAFAEKYGIPVVYPSIDAVFDDPAADIVYLTTPHNTHFPLMMRALEAGKHLLVEKSITLNSRELETACALARQKGLVLAEAQTIWHMPVYRELWPLTGDGPLGRVQLITMNFGSFKDYDMTNRFFNMSLAGGAMLDIGVYALSVVRSFMSSCPEEIVSQWLPSPTGSDEQATVLLKNADNQMATVALSMHSKQPKRAMISCERGYIEIMEYPRAQEATVVDAVTGEKRVIRSGDTADALSYELADVEEAIRTGDTTRLRLPWTRDVMAIMTRLRKDWGMKYPGEEW